MALIPIRTPVGFTTDSSGAGSVVVTIAQAFCASVTFIGQITGANPIWTITAAGMLVGGGSGNVITMGPLIAYPGEQLTVTVAGATPLTAFSGAFTGQYSTVGIQELPVATLAVNSSNTAPVATGGARRLLVGGFLSVASGLTVDLINPVAGELLSLYRCIWSFTPVGPTTPFAAVVPGWYNVVVSGTAGQPLDSNSVTVMTAAAAIGSTVRSPSLYEHPNEFNPGAGLEIFLNEFPTGGAVWFDVYLLYTQQ